MPSCSHLLLFFFFSTLALVIDASLQDESCTNVHSLVYVSALMSYALLQEGLCIAECTLLALMSNALLQDESCIAAHLGERAPKVADDESAALEQQDGTQDVDAQDGLGDSTGDTLAVVVLSILQISELTLHT